jgi:hypothetical protein
VRLYCSCRAQGIPREQSHDLDTLTEYLNMGGSYFEQCSPFACLKQSHGIRAIIALWTATEKVYHPNVAVLVSSIEGAQYPRLGLHETAD